MSSQRIDKWLYQARFFKTRSLSTRVISQGGVRVNGMMVAKPSYAVKEGDVITFVQKDWVRVVCILGIGKRRGPASEAQLLFDDQSGPRPKREKPPKNPKFEGKGRPTGKDRRALSSFSKQSLE